VEACDDGNQDQTDACLNNCSVASCGDRFIQVGAEDCDDGNQDQTDNCLNNCSAASCGDSHVQAGVEACDDGNQVQTDLCLNDCSIASCGDSHVQAGVEGCDDGNQIDADRCRNSCELARCGDGIRRVDLQVGQEGYEACDDGNFDQTDACLDDCSAARCGDGLVHDGVEACDDGNNDNGDACQNSCELPLVPCGNSSSVVATTTVGSSRFSLCDAPLGVTQTEAVSECNQRLGYLGSVDQQAIQQALHTAQRDAQVDRAWIGAREGAGNCNRLRCWHPWNDREFLVEAGFTNWGPNEPVDGTWGVYQRTDDGRWYSDDHNNQLGRHFWCETEADLLSANKTATQSSTLDQNDSPALVAGFALDGERSMGGTPGRPVHWFAQTTREEQPWWQVDLEQVRNVREVALWSRDDGGGPLQLADFVIQTSTDGQNWQTFAQEQGSAGRPSRYEGNAEARYVRVQLQGTNYLAIMEAEVFGF
jgi:cysteine-rich repeat protein